MGPKVNGFVAAALLAAVGGVAVTASVPVGAATGSRALQTTRLSSGRFATTPDTFSLGGNAGYLGNTSTSAKVKLKVTVPVLDCSASPPAPLFVQVFLNGTLKGGAFSASGMYIGASCTGTTPTYTAQLVGDDVNGAAVSVSPGDVLSFDGTAKAHSESYTLTDVNTAQSVTGTGAGLTPQNLQLTVQGGFSGNTVFPPFTSPIKYSAIKVNGAVFSTLNPGGSEEVDSSNKLEIKTSALSAAGDSFTLKYVSNT